MHQFAANIQKLLSITLIVSITLIHTLQRMFADECFKSEASPNEYSPRSTWKDKRLKSISDRLVVLEQTLEQFRLGNAVYLKMRENLDKIKEVHEKYFTA